MPLSRIVAGALLAAAVALVARRAGSLSTSGAVAAVAVGTAAVAGGWGWGALLLVYFFTSSALSRMGRATKEARTGGVIAKGGTRDGRQVLANGGMFALGTLVLVLGDMQIPAALALGALAAATADTWATEIGTLIGGTPRSLRTLRPVAPGTSGGVSLPGTLAMVTGAAVIGLAAKALGLADALVVVTVAGTLGALTDSIIGATIQERRWCATCQQGTERRVHDCGADTSLAGGQRWIDNDVVNFVATVAGAAVAAVMTAT